MAVFEPRTALLKRVKPTELSAEKTRSSAGAVDSLRSLSKQLSSLKHLEEQRQDQGQRHVNSPHNSYKPSKQYAAFFENTTDKLCITRFAELCAGLRRKEGIISLLSRHWPFSSQARLGTVPGYYQPSRFAGPDLCGERCGIPPFAKGAKDGAPTVLLVKERAGKGGPPAKDGHPRR